MEKKFTYIETTHFNNCEDCPFHSFIDDDYSPTHFECIKLNKYISLYPYSKGTIDYRNNQGVLDKCPFLKTNTISYDTETNEQDN